MSSTTTEPGATAAGPVWHTLSVSDALQHEEVDPTKGLSAAEAETRLQKFGPNAFAQAKKEPGWRAFLRQFRDPMQIVLLVAARSAASPSSSGARRIVLFGLALLQRRDGAEPGGQGRGERRRAAEDADRQDARASWRRAAPDPSRAGRPRRHRARRSWRPRAGGWAPASSAATLEIDESALTGESAPVPKEVDAGRRRSTRRWATAWTWRT